MTRRPMRPVDTSRLRELVADVVSSAGYDLEGCSAKLVGRRFLVRIAVDCDGGIDLDGVAELSRQIAARLDDAEANGREIVPGEYELEVGSPGVDRPLTAPRHWRRNRGRLARVKVAGLGVVVGRVTAADEDGVTLDVEGVARRVPYSGLGSGRVEIEFSRPGEEPEDPESGQEESEPDELEQAATAVTAEAAGAAGKVSTTEEVTRNEHRPRGTSRA